MANGDKVCKNGKKSGGFLLQSYIKCVISEICFALVKSYSTPARLQRIMRKALLLLQFFKVLWLFSTYLIIRNYCFGEESGKSLEFLDL